MLEALEKLKKNKIFRGAYSYTRSGNTYSEETFEVFKDKKELGLNFFSTIHSRVSTGELLTINVIYMINKNYIPQLVTISRSLGKESSQELFEFDNKRNQMHYVFTNGDEETEITQSTPPKFHVATPTAANCMLYLRSKKFDSTTKNFYSLIVSQNKWQYEEEPVSKNLAVQRISLSSESLNLDGSNVQAMQYKLFEAGKEDTNENTKVFVSQYITIPYVVQSHDGTKIKIKYLNNLSDDG